jgi:hypothetical protein
VSDPTYTLTLRAEPSSVPPILRLRRLLKIAGRYLGLKCIDVTETTPPPATKPPGSDALQSVSIHDNGNTSIMMESIPENR